MCVSEKVWNMTSSILYAICNEYLRHKYMKITFITKINKAILLQNEMTPSHELWAERCHMIFMCPKPNCTIFVSSIKVPSFIYILWSVVWPINLHLEQGGNILCCCTSQDKPHSFSQGKHLRLFLSTWQMTESWNWLTSQDHSHLTLLLVTTKTPLVNTLV